MARKRRPLASGPPLDSDLARELVALRWRNTTDEERKAHSLAMNQAYWTSPPGIARRLANLARKHRRITAELERIEQTIKELQAEQKRRR